MHQDLHVSVLLLSNGTTIHVQLPLHFLHPVFFPNPVPIRGSNRCYMSTVCIQTNVYISYHFQPKTYFYPLIFDAAFMVLQSQCSTMGEWTKPGREVSKFGDRIARKSCHGSVFVVIARCCRASLFFFNPLHNFSHQKTDG